MEKYDSKIEEIHVLADKGYTMSKAEEFLERYRRTGSDFMRPSLIRPGMGVSRTPGSQYKGRGGEIESNLHTAVQLLTETSGIIRAEGNGRDANRLRMMAGEVMNILSSYM